MLGNPDAALAGAARVIEAEYDFPFQGHTAMGPAHGMADPSDGQMTIYSNDMKSYGLRRGVAEFLQMPQEQVRVVWMEGPQAYGRTAADSPPTMTLSAPSAAAPGPPLTGASR